MKHVLKVKHLGEFKMVGIVFRYNEEHIFFHEENVRSQKHWGTNSPGGIDVCVIDWLTTNSVHDIIHQRKGNDPEENALKVNVDELLVFGDRHGWDKRDRIFLDLRFWTSHPRISDTPWIPPGSPLEVLLTPFAGIKDEPRPAELKEMIKDHEQLSMFDQSLPHE